MADRNFDCTWAPTVLAVPQLLRGPRVDLGLDQLAGDPLAERMWRPVRQAEELGIDHLLVAQRWWGTGAEIEGSSFDCIAMTACDLLFNSEVLPELAAINASRSTAPENA